MPSDPSGKARVRIAFLLLFVFIIALSVGAYFVSDLSKLQDDTAARTALQGITYPGQIDEALAQHPSNKFLRLTVMAIKAANERNAARKVMVFQRPCGTLAVSLWPRYAHPRNGAILVQVSSMKTSRSGSTRSWYFIHWRRRRATSGRSRSPATTLFF